LKENARGSVEGFSRLGLGKALVAGQVALSLVLLVGAGLFAATMRNLLATKTGFDQHDVLIVSVDQSSQVPMGQRVALHQAILEKMRAVPGVDLAASSTMTPISNQMWNEFIYPEGFQAKSRDDRLIYFNRISPGYFRTMGTALLGGRDFTDRDTAKSEKVMILNQAASRHFFGSTSPVGKLVGMDAEGKPGTKELFRVVGVVQDAKYAAIKEDPVLTGYLPAAQDPHPWPTMNFELRSSVAAGELSPLVRAAVAAVDRSISLEFRSFETQVSDSLAQQRMLALLSTFFGGLALLLAVIGLYGVTAYSVLRRQGEIGIRMALGARRGSVISLVLRDVFAMLIAGTVVGVAVSLAAGRLVTSLLYGVKPTDVATLAAAAVVLGTATAIAGFVPALRASRLDPMAALRDE
jgi:predicted permease